MSIDIQCLVGVDGGGSGTRVRLARPDGVEVGYGEAGPSALALGVDAAWTAIGQALDRALEDAVPAFGSRPDLSSMAVGIGVAGVSQPEWREAFLARQPGFGRVVLESDGFTSLLGAHGGQPGVVVAVGTGSVALAWWPDGRRQQTGGWGFPSSDEGSGAWLGLQAVNRLQHELDGRAVQSPMGQHLLRAVEAQAGSFETWLAQANQTRYAALAPIVLTHADDPPSRDILQQAGRHLALMLRALDPECQLPSALCGGLAEPLRPWLPAPEQERFGRPLADSSQGALRLALQSIRSPGGLDTHALNVDTTK